MPAASGRRPRPTWGIDTIAPAPNRLARLLTTPLGRAPSRPTGRGPMLPGGDLTWPGGLLTARPLEGGASSAVPGGLADQPPRTDLSSGALRRRLAAAGRRRTDRQDNAPCADGPFQPTSPTLARHPMGVAGYRDAAKTPDRTYHGGQSAEQHVRAHPLPGRHPARRSSSYRCRNASPTASERVVTYAIHRPP